MSLDETAVAVTLARIETKLDTALVNVADHENRIRALEARPGGITPKAFLSTAVGIATVASGLATFVTLATR